MLSHWFARAPGRLVQAGLCMFFAGAAALLLGAIAQLGSATAPLALADRFPSIPTWFVPEGALGFTAAATLVCWGVWALGAGLHLGRQARNR